MQAEKFITTDMLRKISPADTRGVIMSMQDLLRDQIDHLVGLHQVYLNIGNQDLANTHKARIGALKYALNNLEYLVDVRVNPEG